MTLLTICQDAAVEIGGFAVPNVIVGNTVVNAQRLLRAAHRVGSDLTARGDWSVMRAGRTFTAVPGEAQPNAVPATFSRLIPETMWDRTNVWNIAGPIPPPRFESLAATYPSDSPPRWFTLTGRSLSFFPAFAGGETVAFQYVTGQFCESATGTLQTRWQADSDVGRISEELMTLGVVAFFLMAQGLPYAAQMAAYEARMTQELANDNPTSGVIAAGDIFAGAGARNWDGAPAASYG